MHAPSRLAAGMRRKERGEHAGRRGVSLKTSHRFSQLVYPRMTPMLKREHPVPVVLIAPLASPNCGGPLR